MPEKEKTETKKEITENNPKLDAFLKAMEDIDKEWKKKWKSDDSVINVLPNMRADVERFSSGSVIIDSILGGGFPKGRIIEVYGPEASGKTSVALTAIGNVQKAGGNCAFIDVEQALDPKYAQILGVDLNTLGFAQPSIAEETLQLGLDIINSGTVDLLVIDSVAALMTKDEYESNIEKQGMAQLARVMSKSLRKYIKACNDNNCSVIFVNQTRDNVGVMFGPKTTTPGGKALKFFASQRLEIKRVGKVQGEDEVIGNEVKVKCIKNKVSAPYGEGSTVLTFRQGINREEELAVVGLELGVLTQKGQTFYYNTTDELKEFEKDDEKGYKIAVYRKNISNAIKESPELKASLEKSVVEALEKKNMNIK